MDFLTRGGGSGPFAVLYWNGSKWVEIMQTTGADKISTLVNANPANGLYQIESADEDLYKILMTEKTGVFVLVKK